VESVNQYIADCQSWVDRLFNQWIVQLADSHSTD